ncbi:MAG: hypothetical protein HY259_08975, partial [Chloroflexi bacterium]|nr:hypothetical protein [Chloroflexota bacterium]
MIQYLQEAAPIPEAPGLLNEPLTRRELLERLTRLGAGALATAMAAGATIEMLGARPALAASSAAPVKRQFRYGMVIDTRRCVGCRACV